MDGGTDRLGRVDAVGGARVLVRAGARLDANVQADFAEGALGEGVLGRRRPGAAVLTKGEGVRRASTTHAIEIGRRTEGLTAGGEGGVVRARDGGQGGPKQDATRVGWIEQTCGEHRVGHHGRRHLRGRRRWRHRGWRRWRRHSGCSWWLRRHGLRLRLRWRLWRCRRRRRRGGRGRRQGRLGGKKVGQDVGAVAAVGAAGAHGNAADRR